VLVVRRRELPYDSAPFRTVSDWARSLGKPVRLPKLARSVRGRPGLARALWAVWRLPVTRVRMPPGAAVWARPYLAAHGPRRLARAVLPLPPDERRYAAGRAHRGLAGQLRRARRDGLTTRLVSYPDWQEAGRAILACRGETGVGDQGRPGPGRELRYYVTADKAGHPLALACVQVFGNWAGLVLLFSDLARYPEASWARYQLHTFVAVDLAVGGVEYLIAGGALRLPPGLQHFQQVLGYRARNVRVTGMRKAAPATGYRVARNTTSTSPSPCL